jgi:hypothetical protein
MKYGNNVGIIQYIQIIAMINCEIFVAFGVNLFEELFNDLKGGLMFQMELPFLFMRGVPRKGRQAIPQRS